MQIIFVCASVGAGCGSALLGWPSTAAAQSPEPPEAVQPEAAPAQEPPPEAPAPGDPASADEPETSQSSDPAEPDLDLDDPSLFEVGALVVTGEQLDDLASLPGAATVVSEEDLEATTPTSANEALRRVPGVHVLDEEGMGLRPNIGFRGLNPQRSRNVLVLEDGVPVALAPYGEPELYYAPRIERMRRLEIVRGSGSILYGPQTIGGVLNYVTLEPPEETTATADARYGSFGYVLGEASVGGTEGDVGYLLHAMHHRNDGPRKLDLRVTDVMGKLRVDLGSRSVLGLKLSVYDERSRSTYLGLTTPQYEADPAHNFAIHDRLPVRRYSASMHHRLELTDRVSLRTTAYGNLTSRNWRRQDFDRAPVDGRAYERIIDGSGARVASVDDAPTDRSAILFRPGHGSRNRSFTVGGLESRARADYTMGKVKGRFIGGARFHFEQAVEQRIDGTVPSVSTGDLRSDETRTGRALAAYANHRFTFVDRLRITPGVRLESLWHTRSIRRSDQVDLDPPAEDTVHTLALIPGIGVSADALRKEDGTRITLFAGIHRGFAPPRTKDAITSTGDPLELEAEYSWNYEAGTRMALRQWASLELTAFHLDFSNQVIPPAEASGAAAGPSDALVNSGRTRHTGLESGLRVDPAAAAGARFRVPVQLSYTYARSRFGRGWREDLRGNALPYAPEHLGTAIAGFEHPVGVSVQVSGNYVHEQYADPDNTVAASADGLVGRIPPRFLLDARLAYTHEPIGLTFYVLAKNLTDSRYIASRSPRGIQPGMFRQIIGGIRGEL